MAWPGKGNLFEPLLAENIEAINYYWQSLLWEQPFPSGTRGQYVSSLSAKLYKSMIILPRLHKSPPPPLPPCHGLTWLSDMPVFWYHIYAAWVALLQRVIISLYRMIGRYIEGPNGRKRKTKQRQARTRIRYTKKGQSALSTNKINSGRIVYMYDSMIVLPYDYVLYNNSR